MVLMEIIGQYHKHDKDDENVDVSKHTQNLGIQTSFLLLNSCSLYDSCQEILRLEAT